METILIPTDLSEVSKNAAEYGIQLAKEKNAKVIMLHVIEIAAMAGDDPLFMPPFDILEKTKISLMKEFENKLREKYSFTNPIESITKTSYLMQEIKQIISEKNIDIIVMGIADVGKLSEFLLGSNSVEVARKTNSPTLIVPKGAMYKPINNIVLACNDLEEMKDTSIGKQISKFVKLFDSKLTVLNVVESFEDPEFEKILFDAKNKTIFENINYSVNFIAGTNLVFTINDFIDKNNVDLLIMIPKRHEFFSQLFHISSTKQMAFHTHIPLLAIHE